MRHLLLFLVVFGVGKGFSQSCNFPAALADSCGQAPFLCGNFLEGYCSNNDSLGNDSLGAWTLTGGGFLRLSPCADSLVLGVQLSDCTDTFGLRVQLFAGTCATLDLKTEYFVPANSLGQLLFADLSAGEVYYLAFDSPEGDRCDFSIQVLAGMGTASIEGDTCACTDGYIQGPGVICPGDVATYTVTLPQCSIAPGIPTGGNGEYCPPPPGIDVCPAPDSLVLVWHIPDGLMFVGDSTGLSIQVAVDTIVLDSLPWQDTLIQGLIWASWYTASTAPFDTLAFCDCSGGCGGTIAPLPILIKHEIREEFCFLSCLETSCVIEGMVFSSPGQFWFELDNCTSIVANIVQDIVPPLVFLDPGQQICAGASITLNCQPFQPDLIYQWNTGQSGPMLTVQPTVTTSYTVLVLNPNNGCQTIATTTVDVIPSTEINLGQAAVLSCAQPCATVLGQQYCQPGTYQQQTGLCETTVFSIGFEKVVQELGVVDTITCREPCVSVMGQEYCAPGDYSLEDSCTIFHFTILDDTAPPVCSVPEHICLPANTQFTVSFFIDGEAPFKVDSSLLPGEVFVSAPMANGTAYVFVVEQLSNGCKQIVSGTFHCSMVCANDPGLMASSPLNGCTDQVLQVQAAQDPVFAPGDTAEFVLHTLPGSTVAGILARNAAGEFVFDPSTMTSETTYYISPVVGPIGPDGHVQLQDPCTKIAPGQPVVFHELQLELGPDQRIVNGQSAALEGQTNALSLGSVTWTAGDETVFSGALAWAAQPAGTTEYVCVLVDGYGCTASDKVLVQVDEAAIFYPNVLMSDSDNPDNRYFTIFSSGSYIRQIRVLEVFDRWGSLAFSKQNFPANQAQEGWDGTVRGKEGPMDVYSFMARVELFNGEEQVLRGDVTLIR
ncbi:MAG: gliding motility-associated C-terminal domain-containing protein [Saprospiraceae bacterium]|nr:gliding motility-associated C-terminal domain-containing protein [Saprospiraceae bacterium]